MNIWIETTQEDHNHGGLGWEYGSCLWSPTTNKAGQKIYELMNSPRPNERVVHFYKIGSKRYFHGLSRVSKSCVLTQTQPPSPGKWNWAKEFYRIELKDFRNIRTPVQLLKFTEIFDASIREEIINDNPNFYPFQITRFKNKKFTKESEVRLAQGKYLSMCTAKLFTLLKEYAEIEDSESTLKIEKYNDEVFEFAEGKRKERETYFFSRNPNLVKAAKQKYGFICQACGFDYSLRYGKLGEGYIECHHENVLSERPKSEWTEEVITNIQEVKILCANCHRMIHRKRPALKFDELVKILSENKSK